MAINIIDPRKENGRSWDLDRGPSYLTVMCATDCTSWRRFLKLKSSYRRQTGCAQIMIFFFERREEHRGSGRKCRLLRECVTGIHKL